ncbi:uncharacterized protein [Clinocottus analis]|uniref:uncharacterized protein n=1 Tax=Clinocottus analis TaxID=304258 RepID=UPI0035C1478D
MNLQMFDCENRAGSRQSGVSDSDLRCLSPDSPVPDFSQTLLETDPEFHAYRSWSPESDTSELEYTPLISQMFDCENRAGSRQSGVSDSDLRCLSPDSPVPQYTMSATTMVEVKYRSTSPESVYSDEDIETVVFIPWLFEDRAASPGSGVSNEEFRPLSPDSPIPEFPQILQESAISHVDLRSCSPESVLSDLETEFSFPTFLEHRRSSLESHASSRLSPDSPLLHFVQPMFELPETICERRSASPESTCSDVEYVVLSIGSLVYDNRPSSPGSGASGDEYQALPPDSPIPEYRPIVPDCVIGITACRSPSSESSESDIEYALSDYLMSLTCGIDDRPDSPKSIGSEIQERPKSVEIIPEYKPLPSQFSISDFTNTFEENGMTIRDVSPTEFPGSDDLSQSFELFGAEERSSLQKDFESDKNKLLLPPKSSIPELKVDTANEATINATVSSTTMAPTLPETSAVILAEYNLNADAKLWFQVHDPQSTGGTFSKTGFMELIANTIEQEKSVQDDDQDTKIKDKNDHDVTAKVLVLEETHQFTSTDTASESYLCSSSVQQISDVPVLPLPVIEHAVCSVTTPYGEAKYAFEIPVPEARTESDAGWVLVSEADTEEDDLRYSPESLIDFRPISLSSVTGIESRASSPESVTTVSEFRPLSPDSPIPEFTIAMPECVSFLRSASWSPETLPSDIDYVAFGNFEFQVAECRASSTVCALPEYEKDRERVWSSQPLPEYRLMSLESVMQMDDKRASSPESMPEFNENRSLSPDSPIPQFAVLLDYTPAHRSSSPESMGSDSESEFMVTSSRDAETGRPSSRESILSVNEFSQLLPDSPVPDFMRILSSYFMDTPLVDRSSSPVSLSSDSEFIALPIDCWIDDSPRPLSPQTVESEEELGFCCEDTELLSFVTSPLLPGQSFSLPNKGPLAESSLLSQSSETKSKEGHVNPDCQKMTGLQSKVLSYEWMPRGYQAESISTLQTTDCEEDFQKDFFVKPSPVQDTKRKVTKIPNISSGELKKAVSQTAPAQTPEETQFLTDFEVYDPNSYSTHRAVTPVLPASESKSYLQLGSSQGPPEREFSRNEAQPSELFSPMSTQFLAPPDYEAIFLGRQTLRVSQYSQDSLSALSPESSDSSSAQVVTEATTKTESQKDEGSEFPPDFTRVLSEFESEDPEVQPEELGKRLDSPQLSDSDVEFFDCRQAFSEPGEVKLERDITYHISEPPSPMPGSRPDGGFLKGSPQYTAHPFLQVQDYKHFSSSSDSLSACDTEGSQEGQTDANLPSCEELPSRDQAGYSDDDDFLGRVRG